MTDHSISRDSRRVPLETRVQLKFEWFGGFISEYSSNISPGGMFIRTQTPEPIGRLIGFELRLGDDFELIRGTGEVVWVRPITQGPDKPAGMGIRYLEITPEGRELIYRMVDNFIAQGGIPFDLSQSPTGSHDQEPQLETGSEPAVPVPPSPALNLQSAVAPTPPPAPTVERSLPPAAAAAVAPAPLPMPIPIPIPQSGRLQSPPAPSPVVPVAPPGHGAPRPIPDFVPSGKRATQRMISPLVLWTSVAGAALVLGALGYLKQDEIIGWFVPDKGPPPVVGTVSRARRAHLPRAAPPVANALPEAPPPAVGSTAVPAVAAAAAPAPAPVAPSPPAAPVPERVEANVGSPVTEVRKITFNQTAEGSDVILWTDGILTRQDWSHYHIDADPPRELVKLYGIRRPYPTARVVVGTAQVLQIRTGYHIAGKRNELHVVLDLAGFGVEVIGIEAVGAELRIHLKGK